uniref:Uncharacterized protein n=1 Tax=Arundo donax TaxID=35708 RepID=A0A0A8XWY9_ARUDO
MQSKAGPASRPLTPAAEPPQVAHGAAGCCSCATQPTRSPGEGSTQSSCREGRKK